MEAPTEATSLAGDRVPDFGSAPCPPPIPSRYHPQISATAPTTTSELSAAVPTSPPMAAITSLHLVRFIRPMDTGVTKWIRRMIWVVAACFLALLGCNHRTPPAVSEPPGLPLI